MFWKLVVIAIALNITLTVGCGSGSPSDSFNGPPLTPPSPAPTTRLIEFTETGTPAFSHSFGAAVRLGDGRVLVTGGGGAPDSAEIYDPATGQFDAIGKMIVGRSSHTTTLLGDGRVLVAGGADADLRSAEVFDPKYGRFSAVGSMASEHSSHTATLLDNGQVLLLVQDRLNSSIQLQTPFCPQDSCISRVGDTPQRNCRMAKS